MDPNQKLAIEVLRDALTKAHMGLMKAAGVALNDDAAEQADSIIVITVRGRPMLVSSGLKSSEESANEVAAQLRAAARTLQAGEGHLLNDD